MKKLTIITTLILFALTNQLHAQDTTYPGNVFVTGNLGIGTTSPQERLHINGALRGNASGGALTIKSLYGTMDIGAQNSTFGHIYTDRSEILVNKQLDLLTGSLASYNTNLYLKTNRSSTRMTILNSNGNVGIGTTNPAQKLDVNGALRINGPISGYNNTIVMDGYVYMNNQLNISHSSESGGEICLINPAKNGVGQAMTWRIMNMTGNYSNSLQFYAYDVVGCDNGGLCNPRLVLMDNGNVGIGTDRPDTKLDVAGTIRAHEVRVCLNQGCDFVFEPDYQLMPLGELEKFVTTNKHLPEVAPAAVMESEGIDLSEMNAKLLQKVEELTLYVIELNKRIEGLEGKK